MTWLRRVWGWLTTGPRWLILPALGAGLAAVIALARGRRAVPSPGSAPGASALTGDAAQAERDRISDEAERARIDANRRAGNDLESIRRAREGRR